MGLARLVYNLHLAPHTRVGVFGGSFNPAHVGHRHIVDCARRALHLHSVLWLVSPQNPLKSTHGMAPLNERMQSARHAAHHPADKVLALETYLGSTYTAHTMQYLSRRWPLVHFVRIMGADNAAQFHHWYAPHVIMQHMPTVVVGRPHYMRQALASPFAREYAHARVYQPHDLWCRPAPAWMLLTLRYDYHSSTAIRAGHMQRDV